MENWPIWIYLPILVLTAVTGVTVLLIWRSTTKLQIERGRKPVFQERCGGMFGMPVSGDTGLFSHGAFSVPFVRLSFYEDFVVISYSVKILLHYSEIENVEVKGGAVHLHHNNLTKQSIVLSGDTARIIEVLERYLPAGSVGSLPVYRECACGW